MNQAMQDLFLNKSEQLLQFCKSKYIFSKADIMRFGLENYYLRADRTIREFVRRGMIRRIESQEAYERNLKGRMAYYQFVTEKPPVTVHQYEINS